MSTRPTLNFKREADCGIVCRANRAQFSEVSLRSFVEEDLRDVDLPTVQGLDENNGALVQR